MPFSSLRFSASSGREPKQSRCSLSKAFDKIHYAKLEIMKSWAAVSPYGNDGKAVHESFRGFPTFPQGDYGKAEKASWQASGLLRTFPQSFTTAKSKKIKNPLFCFR